MATDRTDHSEIEIPNEEESIPLRDFDSSVEVQESDSDISDNENEGTK